MKRIFWGCLLMLFMAGMAFGQDKPMPNPQVVLQTNKGTIVVELYPAKAPLTVKNFLDYTASGFYNGTIFHRVIPGFMIQGGGFSKEMAHKPGQAPIQNEADNGLQNLRGTISMARTQDPHSASSQFFINTKDNPFLNYQSPSLSGWGYAVFGRVVQGMDVVDAISNVRTTIRPPYRDVPMEPIEIIKVETRKPTSDG